MEFESKMLDKNTELGIVKHGERSELQAYAYGFVRTADYLAAYLGKDGILTKWDGERIGIYRIVASWSIPRSYLSSRMSQVEATLDHDLSAMVWTGRSAGVGMLYRARPKGTRK